MQIGLAYSVPVIHLLGAIHTSAYRLSVAALVMTSVYLVKRHSEWRLFFCTDNFVLGIAMAGMAIFFSIAIANMPLALATCIEFMGPLTVVLAYNRNIKILILVIGALIGIYLMLVNTQGQGPVSHIWAAIAAAVCWAAYIVAGKRVSQSKLGIYSICPALITAAITSLMASAWEPNTGLSNIGITKIFMIALLYPLGPYIFDLLALKKLKQSTFGILTSIEPIIALAIGLAMLNQPLTYFQVTGLFLVVTSNAAVIHENKKINKVFKQD
jgi:inner membrane transporter RhtA